MITGRVPFEGESVGEVLIKHLTTRPDLSKLPEPYKTIIGQALAKDPAHRQVRVVDLLPPGDAPRARDVRFIGEGKVASPAPPPRGKAARGRRPPDHRRGAGPLHRPRDPSATLSGRLVQPLAPPPAAAEPAASPGSAPPGPGASSSSPASPARRRRPFAAGRAPSDAPAAPIRTAPGRRVGQFDALGCPVRGAGQSPDRRLDAG